MLTDKEQLEYLQLLQDEDYYKCEQSLSHFVRSAWNIIEPGTKYLHNWHIDLICEYLTAVQQQQIKKLIINIPFRQSKSILASIMFPCWTWIHQPTSRWIFASYAQDLSTELSVKRRRIIQSEWYQSKWGGKDKITTDTNIKTWFANSQEGSMLATSVGGSITGKGGNYLLGDDVLKTEEAQSDVKRKAANDWFDNTFSTRLNDRKKDAIILIMHRLHIDDLTGHLLRKKFEGDHQYEVLTLPMVETKDRIISYPISQKQIQRREGDILWEARNGIQEIQAIKEEMGTAGFEAQCQQSPQIKSGNLIKREWWKYYKEIPSYTAKYQSLDTAIKTKEENDYTACITMVVTKTGYYITDVWRFKVEAPELKRAVIQQYHKELPTAVIVEDKASGQGLIQEIKRETSIPIIGIQVSGDKKERLNAQSPTIEAGKVYLPENAGWVVDFVDELSAFPSGRHDDQIDALSQLLKYAKEKGQQKAYMESTAYDIDSLRQMLEA